MRTDTATLALMLGWLPFASMAQEPLSAIDWLRRNPPQLPSASAPYAEPPVSDAVVSPEITVTSLDSVPMAVGLVPSTVTGLPLTLWQGSEIDTLKRLIRTVPVRHNPAMQSVLYTLLLAEAMPPGDARTPFDLTLVQIDRLMDEGAVEPAEALARQAGPTRSRALFSHWFDAALLTGTENAACAALSAQPHLAPNYGARIFCSARRGDWPAAVLMLDSARALGELDEDDAQILDMFLHSNGDDPTPVPPAPQDPDPLTFRLFQAIGEPLHTGALPRAFAYADISDLAGWKAQLEAAERLARTGALSANRFLGIYTARKPAASGGIWDRVDALERFEAALKSGNATEISRRLGPAWDAMRAADIEITFASLFAERLTAWPPDDPQAAHLAWKIRLLSDDYEDAARAAPDDDESRFLAGIALGDPPADPRGQGLRGAIAAGFAEDAKPPFALAALLEKGALGEAILRAIALFQQGADGNPRALSEAIATLRAVGLEDAARRATLQMMLLEPRR